MAAPTTLPPVTTSLIRTACSWGVRGALAGFVIWVCFWTIQGISALARPAIIEQQPSEPVFNPIEMLNAQDLDAGAWQFLDPQYDLSAEFVSIAEAQAKIIELPRVSEGMPPKLSRQHKDLLKLLQTQGKKVSAGPYWRYSLQQQGFQVVAFKRRGVEDELVSVRWMIPITAQKMWLLEQSPHDGTSSKSEKMTTIIPDQVPHHLLAQRVDGTGLPYCQLVVVDVALIPLLEELHKNAWETSVPEHDTDTEIATIHLVRGNAGYWMVASSIPNSKSIRLLLIRDSTRTHSESKPISPIEHSP
jgi:hypothetical protein